MDVVTAVAAVGGLLVGAPLIALALARAHRDRLLGAHLGLMLALLTVFSFSWLSVSGMVVGGRGPGGGAYSENWDSANKFLELMAAAPCFGMLIVGLLFTIGAAWRRRP